MNLKKYTGIAFSVMALALISSCKKDDDNKTPSTNKRNIKYEIKGNYTGHLNVVYNDNVNGNTTLTVTTLPWTKEVTYASNVVGIGIGGNTASSRVGQAGQNIVLTIYAGGTIARTTNATADANGLINLPTLTYIIP